MYEHQGRDTRISYIYSIPMYERTNIKTIVCPQERLVIHKTLSQTYRKI